MMFENYVKDRAFDEQARILCVKVVDVFGCDTSMTLTVEV